MNELHNTEFNEFLKLKTYIKNGEYQKIDKWFKQNKISENPELENDIAKKIIEEIRFYLPDKHNPDKTKIEIAILRNLSFENQLKLLFQALSKINKISSDYFKELKLTSENRKILESSEDIVFLITERFATEEFTEIDKIQKILGFNVMEQKNNAVIFCYDIKHIGLHLYTLTTYLPINKPIFSPKCDIIFNYSEDKRKFLEERNIALPTIEIANSLCYEMKKAITYKPIREKLDQSLKKYEAVKLSLDLENELKIKKNTEKIKQIKI